MIHFPLTLQFGLHHTPASEQCAHRKTKRNRRNHTKHTRNLHTDTIGCVGFKYILHLLHIEFEMHVCLIGN